MTRRVSAYFLTINTLSTESKQDVERRDEKKDGERDRETQEHATSLTHNSCMGLSVLETELQGQTVTRCSVL